MSEVLVDYHEPFEEKSDECRPVPDLYLVGGSIIAPSDGLDPYPILFKSGEEPIGWREQPHMANIILPDRCGELIAERQQAVLDLGKLSIQLSDANTAYNATVSKLIRLSDEIRELAR